MLSALALYIGGGILFVGALFVLVASIGVIRLPDLYTRMHAASKAGAVGGGLILLAVAITGQDAAVAVRALIGIIFLVLTTPIAAHLLARASHLSGYKSTVADVLDEFAENEEQNSAS